MIPLFEFTHRFKKGMLEISSNTSYDILWKYLDPLQKERLPSNITFKVKTGKKQYDIIRLYESGEEFFSQNVIDVLSLFTDMTDKCYPINIDGIEKQYYAIYNLEACSFLNREESTFEDEPCCFKVNISPLPLFSIEDTKCIIVSLEVKKALLKHKLSNIRLLECFGCTLEEYKENKESLKRLQIHEYRDK